MEAQVIREVYMEMGLTLGYFNFMSGVLYQNFVPFVLSFTRYQLGVPPLHT